MAAVGIAGLYFVLVGPLCGLYVPVHLFPDWLRTLAYATPFPSMWAASMSSRGTSWKTARAWGVHVTRGRAP